MYAVQVREGSDWAYFTTIDDDGNHKVMTFNSIEQAEYFRLYYKKTSRIVEYK